MPLIFWIHKSKHALAQQEKNAQDMKIKSKLMFINHNYEADIYGVKIKRFTYFQDKSKDIDFLLEK